MKLFIEPLAYLGVLLFLLKMYYHFKFNVVRGKRKSVFIQWMFQGDGLEIFLPIFKAAQDDRETKLIRRANLSLYLAYTLLVTLMIMHLSISES